MKNEKMMKEASPIKLLFTMGLPTIVVMIVQVLYHMADVFFIGQSGVWALFLEAGPAPPSLWPWARVIGKRQNISAPSAPGAR